MRRVVVTGLGTINPLGKNVKDSWDSLINSKSGLKNITTFDVNEYPCQIAGSIDPKLISEDIVSPREQRKIDRFITLGLIAAHEAFPFHLHLDKQEVSLKVLIFHIESQRQ